MRRASNPRAFAAVILLCLFAWADIRSAGAGHARAFSAGEPGDPKKPARIVIITIAEVDGKMMFTLAKVEVNEDEQIRFVLRNHGKLEHEFLLATSAENRQHAEVMKNDLLSGDKRNAAKLSPKTIGEFVWKFTRPGQFEFACPIPGHREKGLLGTVIVR